jgi:hypothetical protein
MTPGGGLTMTVRLPTVEAAHCAPASPRCWTASAFGVTTAARGAAVMTRVLIVDDEPQILRALPSTCTPGCTTCRPPLMVAMRYMPLPRSDPTPPPRRLWHRPGILRARRRPGARQ